MATAGKTVVGSDPPLETVPSDIDASGPGGNEESVEERPALVAGLPPAPLPPLPDPCFGYRPGPYALSELRSATGTRINPDARRAYTDRERALSDRGSITCAHPRLREWLGDVGSFDPHSAIRQPPPGEWPLSEVLPTVSVRRNLGLPFELDPGCYAIEYAGIAPSTGRLPDAGWARHLRKSFPAGSKLLLAFFERHAPIAAQLWVESEFWAAEFLEGFDYLLLPDFSSYSNDPIPRSLIGERQQQIFAAEGSRAGRVVIPTISWRSEDSFRRQLELWTSFWPHCNTIALNCYGSGVNKTLWAWRWLFAIERYCTLYPHMRWIVAGMNVGWMIGELRRILGEDRFLLLVYPHAFLQVQRAALHPDTVADRFRARIEMFAAYRRGDDVATPVPRPERPPTFAEIRHVSTRL